MAQTLLQLVNQAQAELGVSVSSTVIANTARPVVQMLNLINGVGQDLMREYEWQALTKRHQFQTVQYEYTGDTSADSTTLSTLSSTTGLTTNPTYFMVSGSGLVADTTLVSVNAGASTAVVSNAATSSNTTTDLAFSQVMYAAPSDFDRVIDDTEWDKTDHWPLLGPSTSQQWEYLRSGWIATGPRAVFRIMADLFQIWPGQANGLYFGFEYISNQWARASGAALSKTAFSVDTDTSIWPDRLMIESLKLRFRLANSMPTTMYSQQDLMRGFPLALLSLAKTADAGSATLSMSGRRPSMLLDERNIPDSGYGL